MCTWGWRLLRFKSFLFVINFTRSRGGIFQFVAEFLIMTLPLIDSLEWVIEWPQSEFSLIDKLPHVMYILWKLLILCNKRLYTVILSLMGLELRREVLGFFMGTVNRALVLLNLGSRNLQLYKPETKLMLKFHSPRLDDSLNYKECTYHSLTTQYLKPCPNLTHKH